MRLHGKKVSKLSITPPRGVSAVLTYLTHHRVLDPVIIGGCLRNKAMGLNVFSDIDVALYASPVPATGPNEKFFDLLAKRHPQAVNASKLQRGIRTAQHSLVIGGTDVDLTFFSIAATAQEKAARAKVGISAIAMDADGTVWAADAFRRDRDNKCITLLEGTKGDIAPSVLKYAARLQRTYFPTFPIIDGTADNPLKAVVKRALEP